MDAKSCKLWTLVLLFAKVNSLNKTLRCEKLEIQTCFDIKLPFNFTTTSIATDSKNQKEIEKNLQRWKALSFLPRCWEVLKPLLCSVYMPECDESSHKATRLPCRSACLLTRTPCRVVENYRTYGGWPDFLECEKFPLKDCDNLTVGYFKTISWFDTLWE